MNTDPDRPEASEPLLAAFATLHRHLDASRPALERMLHRPRAAVSPWRLALPLCAAALLLWLTARLPEAPPPLPRFASTLQWSAPSDVLGPALPGYRAVGITDPLRTSDATLEGATP